MRRHDLITSSLWLCVSLFITLYAPQFGLGTLRMPGSGLMPFLIGIVMCICSAVTFLMAYTNKSGKTERIWTNIQFQKLIFVLLVMLIYTLLLKTVGFIACTFVLILVLIRFVDPQPWLTSFLGAGLTSIVSYLIFEIWLKTQLPKGFLGF